MNYIELKNAKDKLYKEINALNIERYNEKMPKELNTKMGKLIQKKRFQYNLIVKMMKEM